MPTSLLRTTLGLMVALLAAAPAYAQKRTEAPYGLDKAEIRVTYQEGTSGPATVELRPSGRVQVRQILLTVSDGRRDYPIQLRRGRNGTFSGRATLPSRTEIQSLRLGDRDENGTGPYAMPEPLAGRSSASRGMREERGIRIEVNVDDYGFDISIEW